MKRLAMLMLVLFLSTPAFTQTNSKKSKNAKSGTYEGCLDQKEDSYVLRTERMLTLIAHLEPVGFSKTLFARFVGQKVSVPGTISTETVLDAVFREFCIGK